jgi:hypothetical protein
VRRLPSATRSIHPAGRELESFSLVTGACGQEWRMPLDVSWTVLADAEGNEFCVLTPL